MGIAVSLDAVCEPTCAFAQFPQQTILPTPILPGANVKQELNIEADGLLGTAVKQALTDASTKAQAQPQSGTQWQIRDTSDGSAVHLRMFRTVNLTEAQTAVAQSSTGGVDIRTMNNSPHDRGLARHYALPVGRDPSGAKTPPGTPT